MHIISVTGATASLECATLLIAITLFLDFRRSRHRRRLVLNIKSTIDTAPSPAGQQDLRPQAA
jgi:hypothetical protein